MNRCLVVARGLALMMGIAAGGASIPLLMAAGPPDRGAGPPCRDGACGQDGRVLVTFTGLVTEVAITSDGGEPPWVDAVLATDGDAGLVRVRIAPQPVLEGAGFRVAVGHRIQVRAFAGGATYDVQRLRDRETGRVLRLRSLRGEPLWRAGGGCHHGGYGPGPHHGPPGADRGHGPGRGP